MSSKIVKDRGAKKSAFSCEQCRKRKVKCGAEQPVCLRCAARNEECEYKFISELIELMPNAFRNPTLSYTQRLEQRIQALEAQLGASRTSESPRSIRETAEPKVPGNIGFKGAFESLSMNQAGRISFHGPTSFLNLPLSPGSGTATGATEDGESSAHNMASSQTLVLNAWQQRALEAFSTTPEAYQYLLNFHWTWIQPVFNFVYRPAFTRDMGIGGPYFSFGLLATMLAHSARWRQRDPLMQHYLKDYEDGAVFARHAMLSLHEDLQEGRLGIPTIQTCLLQSAAQCSKGNWGQAWMYSGIAFRLIEDHGINVDQRYSKAISLTEEDIEIRKRLFWSCYLWDKIICLYLGRVPTVQRSGMSPSLDILDDSSEEEFWLPHGIQFSNGREYPPRKAHSVTSFIWICKLAEVLNELLLTVYNPLKEETRARVLECLMVQKSELQRWWKGLPEWLRVDPVNMPLYCPPSHIVTLNTLYHTVNILLHRPLLSRHSSPATDRGAIVKCLSSASAITIIFGSFSLTYGHGYSIMTLSYSIYMAASVFLLQIQASQPPDQKIVERLQFCIDALESVSSVNAVLQQALRIIYAELESSALSAVVGRPLRPDSSAPGQLTAMNESATYATLSNNQEAFSSNINMEMFDFDTMEFSETLLDALGTIEPISAYVGNEGTSFAC